MQQWRILCGTSCINNEGVFKYFIERDGFVTRKRGIFRHTTDKAADVDRTKSKIAFGKKITEQIIFITGQDNQPQLLGGGVIL